MRFFVLDDEPIALRVSIKIIQNVMPDAHVSGFGNAEEVFHHVNNTGESPDVVFSDIEMPGMSGIEFAVRLKTVCPQAAIIFVTAYSQYALEAFRLHVHGYILKPITADRVLEELEYALQDKKSFKSANKMYSQPSFATGYMLKAVQKYDQDLLKIQCFGNFEVFWKGVPLKFARRQTKELLAYLIDRRGTICTSEEIAAALWENEDNIKNLKARIRILISDLRHVLESIGKEDIIIRTSGQIAIQRDAVDCDYYRMLEGDIDAINSFQGEYMVQYSWAEITAGQLTFSMST